MNKFWMSVFFFAMSAVLPVLSRADGFDFASLKVTRDIRPGLWQSSFMSTPALIQSSQSQGCMSKEDMLRAFSVASDPNKQPCQVQVLEDSANKAKLMLQCPAIQLPAIAGLPAGLTTPPANIPMTIVKTAGFDQWLVDSQMPSVFGLIPSSTWHNEYSRVGECGH